VSLQGTQVPVPAMSMALFLLYHTILYTLLCRAFFSLSLFLSLSRGAQFLSRFFTAFAIINWHKEGPEEAHGMKPKAQPSKMKSKLNPT